MIRAFSEEIIRREIKLHWCANARADMDLETMKLMKRSGCRLLCVGFESADQDVLKQIKKRNSLEKMENFCRNAKKSGILIHGCFIAGAPGDTPEKFKSSVAFAKRMKLDTAQFFPIMAYPGAELFNSWKAEGYVTSEKWSDWVNKTGQVRCNLDTDEFTAEELMDLCDDARLEFYLSPGFMMRKLFQSMKDPGELARNLRGGWKLSKHLMARTRKKEVF